MPNPTRKKENYRAMDITASTAHGRVPITVIHIKGSIDSSTHHTFQAVSETIINDGARHLLIDLKDAHYISSAGLAVLRAVAATLADANGALVIVDASEPVRLALKLAGDPVLPAAGQ